MRKTGGTWAAHKMKPAFQDGEMPTSEEVALMRPGSSLGGHTKEEWQRLVALSIRPLTQQDVPTLDMHDHDNLAEVLVREDGWLFRRNPATGRLKDAHGALNARGTVSWEK